MLIAELLDHADAQCKVATKAAPFVWLSIADANMILKLNGEGELSFGRNKHGFHYTWLAERLPGMRARVLQTVIESLEKPLL